MRHFDVIFSADDSKIGEIKTGTEVIDLKGSIGEVFVIDRAGIHIKWKRASRMQYHESIHTMDDLYQEPNGQWRTNRWII